MKTIKQNNKTKTKRNKQTRIVFPIQNDTQLCFLCCPYKRFIKRNKAKKKEKLVSTKLVLVMLSRTFGNKITIIPSKNRHADLQYKSQH